jgi:fibronectin type 3 domain-containing protein
LFVPDFGQAARITSAPTVTSSSATLSWDKSPGRDVKGYRLHYGTSPARRYWRIIDVGKVTKYTISNLIAGKTYYFIVTAYNAAGKESPASNEISFIVSAFSVDTFNK